MIAVIRADTQLISDGDGGWINVPDVKFAPGDRWGAYAIPGQSAFVVWYERQNGQRVTTLWHGPHLNMGPQDHTLWFVQAPTRILQRLRNQLGESSVVRLKVALRNRRWLRRWCRDNGFRPIKNSAGENVGVYPPLVIAGRNPEDFGDDNTDRETADALADLEN